MPIKITRVKAVDFAQIIKQGKRRALPSFSLVYNASSPVFSFAVVATKKLFRRAVDRNKLRRRFFSILRSMNKEEIKNFQGSVIFFPKTRAMEAKFIDLKKEILDTIQSL